MLCGTEGTQTLYCSLYCAQCCGETEDILVSVLVLNANFQQKKMLPVNDTHTTTNSNHYSKCLFHASTSNRILIQHSLTVIPPNSILPLTNNLTQRTVGANIAQFSIIQLLSVQCDLNEGILYTVY